MYGEPQDRAAKHAAVQRLCDCIALALLLYAFSVNDLPLVLGAGAVLLGSLPRYFAALRIGLPQPFLRGLRAFSLTVLAGAIVWSLW